MDFRIISADGHIDMTWMPGDLWVANAPAKWRDQVPQVRQTPKGPRWYAEEKELGVFGGLGFGFNPVQRGHPKHVDKMFDVGFYDGGPHPTTPELRLKDQQLDGVDAEVMYGILGIGMRLQQPELTQLVYEIYNDWYRHPDGIWPDSRKWIEQDLAGLSASIRHKILCENAGKLYGLL